MITEQTKELAQVLLLATIRAEQARLKAMNNWTGDPVTFIIKKGQEAYIESLKATHAELHKR